MLGILSQFNLHLYYPRRRFFLKESYHKGSGKFVTRQVTPLAEKLENLCYTLPMAVIRSSDIGNYLYCRRAWWYKKQGMVSENQTELAAGTELHHKHGRQVLASSLTRSIGLVLLMIALAMLVAYCTAQIL